MLLHSTRNYRTCPGTNACRSFGLSALARNLCRICVMGITKVAPRDRELQCVQDCALGLSLATENRLMALDQYDQAALFPPQKTPRADPLVAGGIRVTDSALRPYRPGCRFDRRQAEPD